MVGDGCWTICSSYCSMITRLGDARRRQPRCVWQRGQLAMSTLPSCASTTVFPSIYRQTARRCGRARFHIPKPKPTRSRDTDMHTHNVRSSTHPFDPYASARVHSAGLGTPKSFPASSFPCSGRVHHHVPSKTPSRSLGQLKSALITSYHVRTILRNHLGTITSVYSAR